MLHWCRVVTLLCQQEESCGKQVSLHVAGAYNSGVIMQLPLSALLLVLLCTAAHAQFVVETNSMHVREPSAIAGEFDVAIGDVS